MNSKEGSILLQGSLAYAPQNPWTFTGTVKENVVFGKDLDLPWYDTVLDACCLHHDLRTFPLGDETLIGDKGLSLSGGQKARISLARY